MLLRMAATRYGRQLLGITDMGEAPVLITPNMVQWRQSENTYLSEFRTHNKYGKVIRHRQEEYTEYANFLIREGLEESWHEPRRAAARLGLAFVGGGAETTFRPDPDPETSSVDGWVREFNNDSDTWADQRDGPGNGFNDSEDTPAWVAINPDNTSPNFREIRRGILLFDTASLGGDTIDAATFSIRGTGSNNPSGEVTMDINVYSSAPASNTALVAGDFDSLGTTAFSTTITFAGWSTSGFNDFVFNASGRAAVDGSGVSKFGVRNATHDAADSEPSHPSNREFNSLVGYAADRVGTANDPTLVVTHTAAGGRIMGSLAGLGGLAGHGGIAGRGGGIAG